MAANNTKGKVPKRQPRGAKKTTKRERVLDHASAARLATARLNTSFDERVLALIEPTSSMFPQEVLRKAIRLLEQVMLVQATGGKVYFEKNGQFETVVIL